MSEALDSMRLTPEILGPISYLDAQDYMSVDELQNKEQNDTYELVANEIWFGINALRESFVPGAYLIRVNKQLVGFPFLWCQFENMADGPDTVELLVDQQQPGVERETVKISVDSTF